MTFLELCQRLRQEVGAAGSGPASVTGQHGEYARLVGWVQQAWTEVQTKRPDWLFMWAEGEIEMEDGYREYALPNDWASFIPGTIFLGDRRLRLLPYPEFRRRYRSEAPAEPRHITVTPDQVLTLSSSVQIDAPPAPGQTLSFEYYRSPQQLTANDDLPRLPEPYHMLIVYRAMVQYGLYENAGEVVQQGMVNAGPLMLQLERTQLPAVTMAGALA